MAKKHSKTRPVRPGRLQKAPVSPNPAKPVKRRPMRPKSAPRDVPDQLPAFTIVGVGASAGGLEAFRQLLEAIPADPGVALIIVQHMAPRHGSMLPHLLAELSTMPVAEVRDGMSVEPNHVYVVPPSVEMGISRGRLHLTPRPDNHTQYNPIDFFFRSLAEYAHTRAIGIILSGTASDGAVGLRDIKGAGGIAIAQEPRTAKYDGMPRAAIATGVVDLVLAPADIAKELVRIGRQLATTTQPLALPDPELNARVGESLLAQQQLARIFSMLRKACGVDFTHYKLPTVQRRLQRRMVLHKLSTLDQYVQLLEHNPNEVVSLYQDILIHVTRFFRDGESFGALSTAVFPAIAEAAAGGKSIRVWVPGCSTGEEAYSVTIALLEFLNHGKSAAPIQVFATDVSESAVERARAGIYPVSISADVSPERLRRYFTRVDGSFRISKTVRDVCIFARQDVTRDPPFSKLDLIVCRNVLIYLDATLQKRLMQVFHYALRPGGYLMLGSAETIGPHSDLFAVADKRHKIYTKKPTTILPSEVDFSSVDRAAREGGRQPHADLVRPGANVQQEANRVIVSRFSPPGVIVDSDLKIVQFRGQTGAYLEPAPGEASLNLLKMAREGLLYGLRTAMIEAKKTNAAVRRDNLRVKIGGRIHEVDLEIIPLIAAEGRHFLILFHDRSGVDLPVILGAAAPNQHVAPAKAGKSKTERDADLPLTRVQQELAASREYLQSIIQDLEAANEELQSANEEILSSNEELQSTNEELDTAKEELQSTNEELNTVNEELQGRNEELSRVNSDLVNLLGSVQIAIVIVAGDLRIRRFTPMAESVLNLIPTDVGRPISDIKPNIDCPDLERLIHEAIDTTTTKEREAQDSHGNWYLLRIRPYKNVENRIDGAVLALFDVDSRHRLAAERAVAHEAVGALAEELCEPVLILDSKHVVRAANAVFIKLAKMGSVVGRPIFELANGNWDTPEWHKALEEDLPREGRIDSMALGNGSIFSGDDGKLVIRARRQVIGGEPMTLVVFNSAEE